MSIERRWNRNEVSRKNLALLLLSLLSVYSTCSGLFRKCLFWLGFRIMVTGSRCRQWWFQAGGQLSERVNVVRSITIVQWSSLSRVSRRRVTSRTAFLHGKSSSARWAIGLRDRLRIGRDAAFLTAPCIALSLGSLCIARWQWRNINLYSPKQRCTTMSTVDSTPPEVSSRTDGIVS